MHWIILALLLFIVQIASGIIIEYRRSNKTITWLFILFIFPLLGFLLYYFVANEYSSYRTLWRKKNKHWGDDRIGTRFERLLIRKAQEGIKVMTASAAGDCQKPI